MIMICNDVCGEFKYAAWEVNPGKCASDHTQISLS